MQHNRNFPLSGYMIQFTWKRWWSGLRHQRIHHNGIRIRVLILRTRSWLVGWQEWSDGFPSWMGNSWKSSGNIIVWLVERRLFVLRFIRCKLDSPGLRIRRSAVLNDRRSGCVALSQWQRPRVAQPVVSLEFLDRGKHRRTHEAVRDRGGGTFWIGRGSQDSRIREVARVKVVPEIKLPRTTRQLDHIGDRRPERLLRIETRIGQMTQMPSPSRRMTTFLGFHRNCEWFGY